VFLGVFPRSQIMPALEDAIPSDAESFDERQTGESALASFTVNCDGRALVGSEVLTSCPWALGRAHDPGREGRGGLTASRTSRQSSVSSGRS
jgi:hypothetical protein